MLEQEPQNQQINDSSVAAETIETAEASEATAQINREISETQPTPSLISAQNQPEDELFEHYEVKNWEFTPRFYKIAAGAAVFNILMLAVFAQGNLLTRRGCDSPMVSKVCQVIDTVYVGSKLLGTDGEYVSKDYEPTELTGAEITYIDVTSETPPLNYPEGYFALANPEEFALRQQQQMMIANNETPPGFEMPPTGSITFPGIPNGSPMGSPSSTFSSGNGVLDSKPNFPKPKNDVVIGNLPGSTSGAGTTPRVRNNRPSKNRTLPNESPKDLDFGDETAENKPENGKNPIGGQKEVEPEIVKDVNINKQPLQDLADMVLVKWTAKEVDLNKEFIVELNATLKADGKFDPDPKKTRWNEQIEKGDEQMINIAKEAIERVGDSGWLGYLRNLGVEKVKFTLVQNDKEITAVITSEQKTPERASTISSGFGGLLLGAKMATKDQTDEKILLSGAKVTSQGKNFILNFAIPKPIAQEMINRKLQEAQLKKQQANPNGTAENKATQNAGK